jgi:hypothetical protein
MNVEEYIVEQISKIEPGTLYKEFWDRGLMTVNGPQSFDWLVRWGTLSEKSVNFAKSAVENYNTDIPEALNMLVSNEIGESMGVIFKLLEAYKAGSTREELIEKYQTEDYYIDDLISADENSASEEGYQTYCNLTYDIANEWSGMDDSYSCIVSLTAGFFDEWNNIQIKRRDKIQNQIRSNVENSVHGLRNIKNYIYDNFFKDPDDFNFSYCNIIREVEDPVRQALRNTGRNMFDYTHVQDDTID